MKKIISVVAVAFALLSVANVAYALDLRVLKVHFLKGDYKAAIAEGEKVLADANKHSSNLDELYYYLGISYLKEGNLLRAADIFDIILKEFKKSRFAEQAVIGLIDYDIAQNDYQAAAAKARTFLKDYPRSKFKAEVQERLNASESRIKAAVTPADAAVSRSDELNKLVTEALQGNPPAEASGTFYFIQIGAFSSKTNARKLADRLAEQGYRVFIAEAVSKGKTLFKVRVGAYKTLAEAQEHAAALKKQGHQTKILP